MIVFDGIVFNLQRTGGISVLFSEIISRLPASSYELVGFRKAPPSTLSRATYRYCAPRLLEQFRRATFGRRGEVFHSTYYRVPKERGTRVVTTVHDFIYERFGGFPRRIVYSTQKLAAIAAADRIVCVSESTRNDLVEFCGARYAARAVVVPNAAGASFRPVADTAVLPQVLFVGARQGYKNFSAVVDALAPLTSLTLVCVGGGAFTRDERRLLDQRINGRYRSAGYLSDAELNLEYNRSLCLAYPSLFEGFGIPILEAMRAGCPAVAVNASSIPEVAGDAAVLLERGTADELRWAFEHLMVTANREAMVKKGLARGGVFTWDETYRRMVAIYDELQGRALA